MSVSERKDFALWLTHFHIRIPLIKEDARLVLEEHKKDPTSAIEVALRQHASDILRSIRERDPQRYDQTVEAVGVAETEQYLISELAAQIARSGKVPWPSEEYLQHHYMRNNRADEFAEILCQYEWVWLHSQHGFVIGDNPLVRWHAKSRRWNYGIKKSGVEITMPLGLDLCLRMDQRHWQKAEYLRECDKKQTWLYNCRQRLAATKRVYGNSPEALDFITKRVIGGPAVR